ncbi:unnamed protein product [Allacma fusca]|uniref:Uncharacterized protein n=1 Tax=Allacma fusca TaxID=39272 RepID=A0A8J2L2F0_9HEXA|nr:unnamed protein product [Allacma fusca]
MGLDHLGKMRNTCIKCGVGNCDSYEKPDFETYPQLGKGCSNCGCAPAQHELGVVDGNNAAAEVPIANGAPTCKRSIEDMNDSNNCSNGQCSKQVRVETPRPSSSKFNKCGAKRKDTERLEKLRRLPALTFSEKVMEHIDTDITQVWHAIIREAYNFYEKFDIGNRFDYEIIGEKVFLKYPQIENYGGKPTAWGFFNTCLSTYVRHQRRSKGKGGEKTTPSTVVVDNWRCIEFVSSNRKLRSKPEVTDFSGVSVKISQMLKLYSEEPVDEMALLQLFIETYDHRSNSIWGGVCPARVFESYPMLASPTFIRREAERLYSKEDQLKMFSNCTAFVQAVKMTNKEQGIQDAFKKYFEAMNAKEEFVKFYNGDDDLFETPTPTWKSLPVIRASVCNNKVSLIKIFVGDFQIDIVNNLDEAFFLFVILIQSFYITFPTKYGQGLKILESFVTGSTPTDLGSDQQEHFQKMIAVLPNRETVEDESEHFTFDGEDD